MIRLRNLAGDTLIYGLVSASRSLVGLVLVPIYTRLFLPGDYGQIDILTTMAFCLTLVFTLGLDTAVAANFYTCADDHDRRVMLTTAITTRATASLVAALIITVAARPLSLLLFQSEQTVTALRLAVWTAPVNALAGFLIETLRLARRPWAYTSISVVNLVLSAGASIFFVAGLHGGMSAVFAGPLAAGLAVIPPGFLLARRHLAARLSAGWLKVLLRIGLPLTPAALAGWLATYANRYCLLYFGMAADVGLLAVGNKTSAPLVLFTSAFQFAWSPFAFSIHKQENAPQIYAKALTYFWLAGGSLALITALFAREALIVFTASAYVPGHIVAGPMALQLMVDGSYYIFAAGLIVTKQTNKLARAIWLATAGSIVANLLLVPPFGFLGAALATLVAYSMSSGLTAFFAHRIYPAPYEWSKLARLVGWGAGIWLAGCFFAPAGLLPALGFKTLLLTGYAAGLPLLGIVGRAELEALRALFWPPQSVAQPAADENAPSRM